MAFGSVRWPRPPSPSSARRRWAGPAAAGPGSAATRREAAAVARIAPTADRRGPARPGRASRRAAGSRPARPLQCAEVLQPARGVGLRRCPGPCRRRRPAPRSRRPCVCRSSISAGSTAKLSVSVVGRGEQPAQPAVLGDLAGQVVVGQHAVADQRRPGGQVTSEGHPQLLGRRRLDDRDEDPGPADGGILVVLEDVHTHQVDRRRSGDSSRSATWTVRREVGGSRRVQVGVGRRCRGSGSPDDLAGGRSGRWTPSPGPGRSPPGR